jgi:hypothetical protein
MMILATTTIIAMMIFPMLAIQVAIAEQTDYDPDYMTVPGVLHDDTYVLFPYMKKSLTIGFSKYGEMIDRDTKLGLEYGGVMDPFATDPAVVAEYEWVEGWIIDITYESGGEYRNVWAFALHSDYLNAASIGGDWQEGIMVDPTDPSVQGGRKTSGGAVTQPIKVLYDGPRRFVALLNTVVYEDAAHNYPLVNIDITVVFNKVKKQVILYKDIKRLDTRKSVGAMQIEFSERGEWDLGAGAPPKSYANIYTYQPTEYDSHYQGWYNNAPAGFDGTYDLLQVIDDDMDYVAWAAWWPKPITSYVEAIHLIGRDTILKTMSTHEEIWVILPPEPQQVFVIDDYDPVPEPTDNVLGNWMENPMVFVNDMFRVEGTHYEYNTATNTITFYPAYEPQVGDVVKAVYKHDASQYDMSEEEGVPFANAEWCFVMDETTDQFRAVTVYGVTDLNDGLDNEMPGVPSNVIDREVAYYMEETFNPYDLNQAVHKDHRRWVQIYDPLPIPTGAVVLDNAPMEISLPTWDGYNEFAERVLVNGVLQQPLRSGHFGWDYSLYVSPLTGVGTITFRTTLPAGTHLKILYSTLPQWSDETSLLLGRETWNGTVLQGEIVNPFTSVTGSASLPTNPLGVDHTFAYNIAALYVGLEVDTNFTNTDNEIDIDLFNEEFKVIYDPNTTPDYVSEVETDDTIVEDEYANVNYTLWVTQLPPDGLRLTMENNNEATYVDNISVEFEILFDTWYNANTSELNVTMTVTANIAYNEHQEGEYEWAVVGKNAATIDSIGAGYVTQAFDSKKQIHVRMMGLDIRDPIYGTNAPYVMAGATTGTRADYYYGAFMGAGYDADDDRCGLHDDWCTSNPVASSNMLFVGGPRPNLGTEYFNEFTMGFYARGEHVTTDVGQSDKILALSCWDKHVFGSGYAVISVYEDLNGTIGFLIWGVDGQDTYYATKWFWDYGIYYLQTENDGVTDLILEIFYPPTDPIHPVIGRVERLGTISHKEQHDCPTETIPLGP